MLTIFAGTDDVSEVDVHPRITLYKMPIICLTYKEQFNKKVTLVSGRHCKTFMSF